MTDIGIIYAVTALLGVEVARGIARITGSSILGRHLLEGLVHILDILLYGGDLAVIQLHALGSRRLTKHKDSLYLSLGLLGKVVIPRFGL